MLLSAVPLHYLRSLRLCLIAAAVAAATTTTTATTTNSTTPTQTPTPSSTSTSTSTTTTTTTTTATSTSKSTTATTTTTVNLTRAPGYANVRQCGLDWQVVSRARGYRNVGALIVTNTILWVPYFNYSIMGPRTLFQLLTPLCYIGMGDIWHDGHLSSRVLAMIRILPRWVYIGDLRFKLRVLLRTKRICRYMASPESSSFDCRLLRI